MIPQPFRYYRQDWEGNSKWLFDAYRKVAFEQKGDSADQKKLERFIKEIASIAELIDPQKLEILTDDNKLHVVPWLAEGVIKPFLPLIDVVTDELLELDAVLASDANRPKGGVDRSFRNSVRNEVAAIMFQAIRDYAVVEHLHRECQLSDDKYEAALETILVRLDKYGMNGLEPYLKEHPKLEEKLKSDPRTFVSEQFKIIDWKSKQISKDWFPNDREMRQIERGTFYQWHLDDLEKQYPKNSGSRSKDEYLDALLTAQYQAIGPEYCKAVEKRNKVMRDYGLGEGGLAASRKHDFDYVRNLGHDLSNKELQKLMQQGTKDLSPEKANVIYQVNNLLGSLDPRLAAIIAAAQTNKPVDLSAAALPAPKKEPETDPSRLLPGGDAGKEQKKSPSPGGQEAASGGSSASSRSQPEKGLSKEKKGGQEKKDTDNFVTAGKIGSTAVLGAVLGGSLLSLAKKPKNDKGDKDNANDKESNKSQSRKRFIAAVAALASAAGIVLVWKYPDVIFGWLKGGGRSA